MLCTFLTFFNIASQLKLIGFINCKCSYLYCVIDRSSFNFNHYIINKVHLITFYN